MPKTMVIIEGVLQDEQVYTLHELADLCVVEEPVLHTMIEFGIIEPREAMTQAHFDYRALYRVQKALRLKHDLSINWEGISLALDLLDEIERLHQINVIGRGEQ